MKNLGKGGLIWRGSMSRNKNSLVVSGIDSLDASSTTKQVLKDIFVSEIDSGDGQEIKKIKVNRCRQLIIQGYKRETS